MEDFRTGKSDYVTIAADPSHYRETYTIPSYTFVNAQGEKHTLTNVPAYVHDTGSAFQGRPRKFDIAADYSTGDAHGAKLDRWNADLNRGVPSSSRRLGSRSRSEVAQSPAAPSTGRARRRRARRRSPRLKRLRSGNPGSRRKPRSPMPSQHKCRSSKDRRAAPNLGVRSSGAGGGDHRHDGREGRAYAAGNSGRCGWIFEGCGNARSAPGWPGRGSKSPGGDSHLRDCEASLTARSSRKSLEVSASPSSTAYQLFRHRLLT